MRVQFIVFLLFYASCKHGNIRIISISTNTRGHECSLLKLIHARGVNNIEQLHHSLNPATTYKTFKFTCDVHLFQLYQLTVSLCLGFISLVRLINKWLKCSMLLSIAWFWLNYFTFGDCTRANRKKNRK